MSVSATPEIIEDIRAGRMVILVDEEDRENEGDLLMAADFVSAESINFMARHGRGLICLTLTEDHCRRLNLPPMVGRNRSSMGTNFTVSIEAATGVTTGISAADRARTVQAAVHPGSRPEDLVQPGHIFPLMAQRGGVLARAGHTEAGCDLAQLAGLTPAAVICEVLREDGEMARLADLLEFGRIHGLKTGTIADLIHYRGRTESLVTEVGQRPLDTRFGRLHLRVFRDVAAAELHLAIINGEPKPGEEVLVRVHEPLGPLDPIDTGSRVHSWNLSDALRAIAEAPCGVLLLLRRQESGDELLSRLMATEPPAQVPKMDLRTYGIGAQILKALGVTRMRIMALPRKMPSMAGFDLEVTGYLLPGAATEQAPETTLAEPKRPADTPSEGGTL